MRTWSSAGDKITKRRASEVISALPRTPIPFEFVNYESSTPAFLSSLIADGKDGPDLLVSYRERSGAYVGDTFSAESKYFHVLDCARQSVKRGALTWGIVDAYHAALLGAKAILAHFGILSYEIEGRTVLVDFFPELGPPDHSKKFAREHREEADLIRVLRPTHATLLDQGAIWALIERVINLRAFATDEEEGLLLRAKEAIKLRPWRSRHDILYNTIYWRWRFDIALSPKSHSEVDALMLIDDAETAELIDFFDTIFSLVTLYNRQLLAAAELGGLIVPPDLVNCAVPNSLN